MLARDRVRNHRERQRAAGLRLVQFWAPDPKRKGFAEECARQARLIRDGNDTEGLEFAEQVADWSDDAAG